LGKIHISDKHPRAESLKIREKLVEGFRKGIVVPEGLIAHGRGECFDYLIGEKTQPFAWEAEKAATAMLLLSKHPVVSINGNTAALCAKDTVKLAKLVKAKVEVNLFYRSLQREIAIANLLKKAGLNHVYGVGKNACTFIPGICSLRCKVDPRGLFKADTVLLAIEDGDRTMVLRETGKHVVAVDLNPFSRTALWASITIVDNVVRAIPNMINLAKTLKKKDESELRKILEEYDNDKNLKKAVKFIDSRLNSLTREKLFGLSLLNKNEAIQSFVAVKNSRIGVWNV